MKAFYSKQSLISLLFVVAAGCSSSDDSAPTQLSLDPSAPTAPTVITLDTSTIRAYQQGDSVAATYTLTEIATGRTSTADITIVVGDVVQNPYGIDCRVMTYTGLPKSWLVLSPKWLFYQDSDNSIYDCGRFDYALGRYVFLNDTKTSPDGIFLREKSPVQIGNITSGVVTFDDNDDSWQDCTSTVQGTENVSTPFGLYESYRVHETCSYSNGATLEGTVWVVPSIFNLIESFTIGGFSVELLVNSYSFN